MKVQDIQKYFPDADLRAVITAGNTGEVSESDFSPNLLKSARREEKKADATIAELFLKQLMEHYGKPGCNWAERVINKFATAWRELPSALSEKTTKACWDILKPCEADIKRHLARQAGIFEDEPAATAFKFAEFPGEERSLSQFQRRAEELSANNYEKGEAICKELKRRDKADPAHYRQSCTVAQKHPSSSNAPYDKNYLGKGVAKEGEPTLFFDASYLQNPIQHVILSALPHTAQTAANYFEAARYHKAKVFISFHEPGEIKERCEDFWKNRALSQIKFRNGTTIVNTTDANPKILGSGKHGIERPSLIAESKLELSDGGKITHLHYDGWNDSKPMPDEELMQLLLDRIEELNPEHDIPPAFNCKGGVGRTGTAFLCYYLRKLIQAHLRAGEPLDEIKINIPELLYAFRGERSGLIGHGEQLAQVYSVTAAYYERLKVVQQVQRFMPEIKDIVYAYAR